MSHVTGSVSVTSATNFTLSSLPSLFTSVGITAIQVKVDPTTKFNNVAGLSVLAVSDVVSVRGLLFNDSGTATLVAAKVRKL
jgi:hypothetical protein